MTGVATGWSVAAPEAVQHEQTLEPGTVVADRYEIIKLLGEGGMGAVYKARDRELDRTVALKVIRPELAGHPSILQRFKQELILARQITHKNVIRIFDLGVSEKLKFITMEYVEGRDLSDLLEQRKFTEAEAVAVTRQVCRALEAAHSESVVHRDLKPQNIMLGENGRVWVMDFGLARTLESTGLTQTGAILGTPAYMSPEQAQGRPADERSDIFSLGIIFYEMLTGVVPFKAESMLATLLKRTQGPPEPPVDLNPSVSRAASDVALKCLATDPAVRYQTASELLLDLDALAGEGAASLAPGLARGPNAVTAPPVQEIPAPGAALTRRKLWIGLTAAVVAVAAMAIGFGLRTRTSGSVAGAHKPVNVVVADFQNSTGDPAFDRAIEPILALALENGPLVNLVPRAHALEVGRQLQPDAGGLSEQLARLVAVREGIAVVVGGAITGRGTYKISVRAVDAFTGREIARREVRSSGKDAVLGAVSKLAVPIRAALGDTTPESAQMAAAKAFSAMPLASAQSYATAEDCRAEGKHEEAILCYLKAIELDRNFGSAYAGAADMYAGMGQREEAMKYYKMALAHTDRMAGREMLRARGGYEMAAMEPQKAADEFSTLVRQYPGDAVGHSSLAFAWYARRDMGKALEEERRALQIFPRSLRYRSRVALYALYAGDFETSSKESAAVLQQDPAYLKAYVTLALSQISLGQRDKASETYARLRGVNAAGASIASAGIADLALYEGRATDAAAELEKGVTADLAAGNRPAAAAKLAAAAEAVLMLGRKPQAVGLSDRALATARASVLVPAARVYVEAGQEPKAAAIAAELTRNSEPLSQAYAKIIGGEIELHRGRAREAVDTLQESLKLSDSWLAHFDLGRAYVAAGAFTQADSEFDLCLRRRRGEANDIFLNEQQTARFFPPIYYYLGRTREGLNSPGAAASYRTFLGLKAKTASDPLAEDARRRLAKF